MKPKAIIFLFSLLFVITSCTSEISIAELVDTNSPLILKINEEKIGLTETDKKKIEPHSEKFKKFIVWCKNNSSGWESTYASYNSRISVSQNNFNLLYLKSGVVITFMDKNGKWK